MHGRHIQCVGLLPLSLPMLLLFPYKLSHALQLGLPTRRENCFEELGGSLCIYDDVLFYTP